MALNWLACLSAEEDRRRAINLYARSISLGNDFATRNLADLIVDEDRESAISLYELAIGYGNASAMCELGNLVHTEDPERAIALYGQAVEAGHVTAMGCLGVMTWNEDRSRAMELLEEAARKDDAYSIRSLADFIKGEDPQRAIELYERAIELGNASAMVNLADLIAGENRERASELLEQAASLGHSLARDRLVELQQETHLRSSEASDGEPRSLEDLCASIAETCSDYRPRRIDEGAVWSWIQQFEEANRLSVLSELDHVLQSTYWSEDRFRDFLRAVVVELEDDVADGDWRSVNFLRTQGPRESQTELLALLDDVLESERGYSTRECGSGNGAFVYLDDGIFTGVKLQHDQGVGSWLEEAPSGSRLSILHPIIYDGGFDWAQRTIAEKARARQVKVGFWYSVQYACAWRNEAQGDILWPRAIPSDPDVMDALNVPESTGSPFEPRGVTPAGASTVFSGEDGRNALEQALLLVGARLHATDAGMRPLGKVTRRSPRSLGFGAMTVTYRNCPNNAPLALWWGTDPGWSPLFHRREGLGGPDVPGVGDFDVAF